MTTMTQTGIAAGQLRGMRYILIFIVLLAANSVQTFVFCVPPPLLPALAGAFNAGHDGVVIAEFVTPIAALGMMLGAIASGFLIARTGLRWMILVSSLAIAVLGSAPLWVTTAPILLGSRLLLGFVSALLLTSSTLLVVQNFSAEDRPRIIGFQTAFSSVAFVVVVMLSGLILRYAGWRTPFTIYAVFGITLFIFSLLSVPRHTAEATQQAGEKHNLIVLLWPIYLTILLFGILVTIVGVQLPFVMTLRGIVSPVVQSFIIGNSTIFSAITGFAYGYVQARIGRRLTLGFSLIAFGLGFFVLGFATNAVLASVGTALIGLAQGIVIAYMISLAVQHAPPSVVGRAVGYAVAALFLGSFMNPFFMGALKALFGPFGALFATGVLTVIGAAVSFSVRRGLLFGVAKLT